MPIRIYQGSILDVKADALVNPANSHLRHSGGLAAIIERAALDYKPTVEPPSSPYITDPNYNAWNAEARRIGQAREAWRAEQQAHPLVATGNAGVTTPGALPHKCIVHAVGPVWNGGGFSEATLLAKAHASAIERAREQGCASIAFPAISCGVFGYPVERAAYVAVAALIIGSADLDITLALFEDAHVEAYTNAFNLILGTEGYR